MNWTNSRVETSNTFSTFNPSFQTNLVAAYTQPLLRGFRIDNVRQQLLINTINRDISEETARATVFQTLANVRNAYWDLVFALSAVDVAQRATDLADKLVEDNQARVEVGTLAPLDIVQAQAEAATRRQNLAAAEATLQTAELALKRYIVSGTDDPLWRQTLRPVDLPSLQPAPTDVEAAVRKALAERTDITAARKNLDSSDISIRYFKNQSLPARRCQRQLRRAGPGRHRHRPHRPARQPGGVADYSRRLRRRARACCARSSTRPGTSTSRCPIRLAAARRRRSMRAPASSARSR